MKSRYLIPVVLSLAGSALAQDQQSAPETAPKPPHVAGGVVLGVTVEETDALAFGYRISKLLHQEVFNEKGERIGRTEDFIVKPDGTVTFAIIDVGGFLGMGAHRVAIPVSQISAVKPHLLVPGATKDALKSLPQFQYAKDNKRS
jgi:sporulation protein YlmC with PRC-barrel domain